MSMSLTTPTVTVALPHYAGQSVTAWDALCEEYATAYVTVLAQRDAAAGLLQPSPAPPHPSVTAGHSQWPSPPSAD